MNRTDPRPTPRRRRWRRFLVCGVIGLNVGIFLGGLFLDEFPPDDADLAPRELPPFSGESNPFEREGGEQRFLVRPGELPTDLWLGKVSSFTKRAREEWEEDVHVVEFREQLHTWCTAFDHEFGRIEGDPWSAMPEDADGRRSDEVLRRDDGTKFLEPHAIPTLARLEWMRGDAGATLHWLLLDLRVAQWAKARSGSWSQWIRAQEELSGRLFRVGSYIELGLWHLVPRLDPDSVLLAPVPEARGLRFFHQEVSNALPTAEGLARTDWFPILRRSTSPDLEFREWRWKPVRFRRRLGELIRPVVEDPSASIDVEPDSRWVRAWIDPYGTRALERAAGILRAERHSYRETTIALALVPLSAAVQAFEDDRLAWPETLEDLVPTYLSEIPPALAPPAVVEFDFDRRKLRVRESEGAEASVEWTLPALVR